MKMNMYTIYDQKLEAYNQPHFMENDAMALRQFADMANDEKISISKHPEDYSLWKIASWQSTDTKITTIDKKLLASAHEHVLNFPKES
jgi:hypothetical protein